MPLGANTNTNIHNGTQLNQENQKILQEKEAFPNPFKKSIKMLKHTLDEF